MKKRRFSPAFVANIFLATPEVLKLYTGAEIDARIREELKPLQTLGVRMLEERKNKKSKGA
jgi:hypothetical protein